MPVAEKKRLPHEGGAQPTGNDYRRIPFKGQSPQTRIAFEGDPNAIPTFAADAWAEANPKDWNQLVSAVVSWAAKHPDCKVSVRDTLVREGISADHNLSAPLARRLERHVPHLRGRISMRKSRSDGYEQIQA